MKTTILLCALASIAAAVPTNHHEILPEQELGLEELPATLQRERKSPFHDHHSSGQTTGDGTDDLTSKSGHKSHTIEGRSLGFKKPIIVKKKIGYHVYRDSDEEMAYADPHENCNKQVKVKLCDDEPGSPKSAGACFTSERNEDMSDKEIENSIKKAKEAVENLQRGFHKVDHTSGKLAKIEDKELEDDLAVHHHIEAARKALEHVQHNFGNLETSHLQGNSPKSTEEERLAQWKEAIDNIQKNVEIARNIEDAFKTDSEQNNLQSPNIHESPKSRESEHIQTIHDSQHKTMPASLSNVELLSDESDFLTKQRENSDVEMFTAPTEQKELKIKLHSDSLRTEKISEEPLGDQVTRTLNIEKTDHMPTMKNSETAPLIEGFLKLDSGNEATDHLHNQQIKAANENIESLENNLHDMKLKSEKNGLTQDKDISSFEKEKSADHKLELAKFAHTDDFDKITKNKDNDMSMAASHVNSIEIKHSADSRLGKSTLKEDSVVTKMALSDEHPNDQSLKLKSVSELDEHHKDGKSESINHNHEFHERMSHGASSPEQANTKNIKAALDTETRFNNGHNTNEHFMRMIEGENMEHNMNEMHKLNEHPISDMRMTEDQKLHEYFMRWANENQLRAQESPLSLLEDFSTPTEISEFTNGQHLQGVHPSMRLSQDQNTELHRGENHKQDPSLSHWAHETQQNPLQAAKTANDFHEAMNWNQRQNMQNQVTDDHSLHNLFLMRLAQEKHQNQHLQPETEFHKGHLHEALPQNRFISNLENSHDMSLRPRMNEHLHIMKHAMSSDMDSSMQPSMHMNMRESMGKPMMEHRDIAFNNHHHHAMARYGSGLPISSGISTASAGAVGLFPNASPGGCGIPLMLSCSPNVVSGTLAKAQSHVGAITAPAYRSGDDLMYYIKRDAKDDDELPTLKIQKTSIPFNHKPELIFDKTQ